MAKEESPLFVGITNGDELRRDVLECSKGILESLKEHERFKNIRHEKVMLIHKLKKDVKEIAKLINTLRTYLPKVKEVEVKKPEMRKVKVGKPRLVTVERPKVKTELERLEEELSEIEGKLNSIS